MSDDIDLVASQKLTPDGGLAVSSHRPGLVVLLLVGGWGSAPVSEANAISASRTPVFQELSKDYPVAVLAPGVKTLNARYLTLGSGQEIIDENIKPSVTLASVLSVAGKKQVKISETERFAAVTHFFNGQAAHKFIGEDWRIVSSEAGGHQLKSGFVLNRVVKEIIRAVSAAEPVDFIVAVIPTIDLAASSGDLAAVKKAVEAVDQSFKTIWSAIANKNGLLIISAASGNAERMRLPGTEYPDTGMTNNPVPFVLVGQEFKGKTIGLADPLNNDLSSLAPAGTLADVAPTILKIMGLAKPAEMTGESLID